ncbi:MAG TPA: 6-hydroxymethylpterin diphosphokinase MptE-like protein [Negativicutes bacterium]|nr:6-hydroxymethylpterin diphosphokinase MptE-like protein [Negativicutes bacterium]
MEKVVKSFAKSFARDGTMTVKAVLADGRSYYLHSSYNPGQEARDWVASIDLQPYTAYMVLGLGLGYHVRELLKVLPPESYIFVVEHSRGESTLPFIEKNMPRYDWLADPRVILLCGPDLVVLAANITGLMRQFKIRRVTVCNHAPTRQLYPDFFQLAETELVAKMEEIFILNLQFDSKTNGIYINNAWKNLPHLLTNPGMRPLKDKFKGMPAIVVSAGPSLNKNIEQLKAYRDKALILASGTALGALRKHGIVPHFLGVADYSEKMYTALHSDFRPDTALLALHVIHPDIMAEYPGNIFTIYHPTQNVLGPLSTHLPPNDEMMTSVSVATTVFNFADYAGCDPIIFLGQDLAFTATATHADGVRTSELLDREDDYYKLVKGQNGQVLKTSYGFSQVLDYFVTRIARMKQTVVNATEGGAHIDGAVHMTFREAADKYLTRTLPIDETIAAAYASFQQPDLKPILAALDDIAVGARRVKEKMTGEYAELDRPAEELAAESDDQIRQRISLFWTAYEYVKSQRVYPYISYIVNVLVELHTYDRRTGQLDARGEYGQCHAIWQAAKAALDDLAANADAASDALVNRKNQKTDR